MRGLWGTSALVLALGVTAGGAAQAQDATTQLVRAEPDITVTATRGARDVFEVPTTVTVISGAEIEENLATDIKDLIRFEPGVSVATSPSRFTAAFSAGGRDGNSSFNIRGLGGNRVLFQVDGIRIPDGFSFGPNAFGRGDYVDLDLLQSVEIVRGPGSGLYGSDGLAGVVSFITKDPEDFLYDDERFAARGRVSYGSADDGWAENVTAAGRLNDQWSALVAYTRRDAHETDNQGRNSEPNSRRTAPNPQDIDSNAELARVVFEPTGQHRFRLTGDYNDRAIATEALSGRAPAPMSPTVYAPTAVIDLDGLDESDRSRVTFDYTYTNADGFIDRAFVAVYGQSSSLHQFSAENRFSAADRTRDTTYDNDVWGVTAQAESLFEGDAQHRLVYGVDYSVTTQSAIRGGTIPTPPTVFPERPFPETDYERTGVFLTDEISLLGGSLVLFPSVRYDEYQLTAHDDALYTGLLSDQSDDHLSPKFGFVAWPTENFGVFFNYATGFKAPAPSEVNNFFENLTLGGAPFFSAYTSVPNPNLGPEVSEGAEAGVRGRDWNVFGGSWNWSASAYSTWFEDFISQEIVGGNGMTATPFIYQYINLNEVQIDGVEMRVDGGWDGGFGVTLAGSYAEGEQNGAPLQSIDPLKIVGALSFNDPEGRFGGQFVVTYAARKEADLAPAGAYRPDAFTIVDLTAYWTLTEAATLRAGVFNATDESYAWWNDARGLTSGSAVLDAYTQPGRNFSMSIAYRF